MEDVRYSFVVEWFDPQASLLRRYNLFFWPESNSIEMFDLKNHRTFLKRVVYPSVKLDNLFIGGCVSVYSRQIKIVDFTDTFTRDRLQQRLARTACMILPSAQAQMGQIIDSFIQSGFSLSRLLTVRLSDQQAKALLPEGESKWSAKALSNGVGTVLELIAPNAVHSLAEKCKSSLSLNDKLLIATDLKHYQQFLHVCFQHGLPSTAVFNNCTIAVIKPHAVRDGLSGQIIQAITDRGFELSAAELLYLDRPTAEEFLEVYKTVIPQYSNLVDNFTSGASIVLQIHGGEDIVQKFRHAAGPHDPEIGKHVRPNTIRAIFGTDRINNALHATDLPEDGTLESEYFFRILQDAKCQ